MGTVHDGSREARAVEAAPRAAADADQPWLGPLTDPLCADVRVTGRDLAALATSRELWTVPPTLVATAAVARWTAQVAATAQAPAATPLPGLTLAGPVTVRGWLAADGLSRQTGPVWYNVDPGSVSEAVIELSALAVRDAPADGGHRLVVAFQDFTPPEASATVLVDARTDRVEVLACLGLDEDLGAGVWRDTLVLIGPDLEVERHDVVHKPTATEPAAGGTHIVAVEPALRGRPAVPVRTGRAIAHLARRTAERLGEPLRLELALQGTEVTLLALHVS